MGKEILSILMGLILAGAASSPTRAMDWLACDGQSVTGGPDGKPQGDPAQAHDIYVLDDPLMHLFKYSEKRKSADPEPVTSYDAKQIRWGVDPGPGSSAPRWQGELNRVTMALKMSYRADGQTTTWAEACKATVAPGATVATDNPQ